jgi:hypothetical protein
MWEKRFDDWNGLNKGLVTVDGMDCRIQEPWPFWKGWCSHKFKGPGVKYELGILISHGEIVWLNGPFPAGADADIETF